MMISNAVIIPDHTQADASSDIVELGSIVGVKMSKGKTASTYTIVGSTEASPTDGRISNESPLGKALLGKKAGDKVEFKTPSGAQTITIVSVQ